MKRSDNENKYGASKTWRGMYDLYIGKEVDELQIAHSITYIKERWDCSDFRMVPLIRTIYQLNDKLSGDALQMITDTILCFKYWLDEPGDDDMCYSTENHQILFHSSEYLAGQYFKNNVFRNSGLTGKEHQVKARNMILQWLEHRFVHGMSEWHSPVYYEEDIPALCNLIDFAEDEEIVIKSKMVLDLLLLDMAIHTYRGAFTVSSGRCYEMQKKHPKLTDTAELIEYIWGHGLVDRADFDYGRLSTMFYMMENYEVPDVIKAIGLDSSSVEIMTSTGLDIKELKESVVKKYSKDDAWRLLWSMNATIHPEFINHTVDLFHRYNAYDNYFIRPLEPFSHPILRKTGINRLLSKLLKPFPLGEALQRSNTYTYKTADFMLSTAQNYHPGEYGAQQHIWSATLSDDITVFTTSPGTSDVNGLAYWVGNSRHPHSAQHKNVNMTIYRLPNKKAFLEKELCHFTHLYFPTKLFDKTIIRNNLLFGKTGNTYVAVFSGGALKMNPGDSSDWIQEGRDTWWITEIGTDDEYGNFDEFVRVLEGRKPQWDDGCLLYDGTYEYMLEYKKGFRIDGKCINTEYPRFLTPYIHASRNSRTYDIEFDDKRLHLDFDGLSREAT